MMNNIESVIKDGLNLLKVMHVESQKETVHELINMILELSEENKNLRHFRDCFDRDDL